MSISDIAGSLPDLPRSSAYRHLVDLEAAGLVRRVTASDEFTRFELAEDLTEHHHHLLCENCGKVIDVTLPAGFEQDVTSAIGKLADAESFQVRSHRLDVLGTCFRLPVIRRPGWAVSSCPGLIQMPVLASAGFCLSMTSRRYSSCG